MKGDKRRIKKIVTGLVILVLLGITLSGVRIRSVGQYKQEQKQLANDLFATPDKTQTDNGTVSETEPPDDVGASEAPGRTSTSEPGKQTTKPKTVKKSPQRTPGTDNTASPQPSAKQKPSVKRTTKPLKARKATGKPSTKTKRSSSVPKATKKPSAAQKATAKPAALTCTITIRCDSLRKHWDSLSDKVKAKMPENGLFLKKTTVNITASDTVYSILQKVCKAKNIALDAEYSTMFSTEYIRGIGYLYEKEAGDMSGWLYRVNGKLPNYGASNYSVKAGDHIEWLYTCTGKVE